MTRASSDVPQRTENRERISGAAQSIGGMRRGRRNLQPQAARKEPECPRGALAGPQRRAAPFVSQSPRRPPGFEFKPHAVTAPTSSRLAAPRAIPGRPVAARALHQVQAQTGGLQIFDSRTERAPGAGGRGIRRANAALCDCGHAAARGRGMGAHSRSLLLLLAAPLLVEATNDVRAAAGLRRAAHKDATAGGTAKKASAGPTPTQRVLDAMRLSLQRWDKVETKRGAQDYVRDILSPAKRGALGRILILNGRVFANDEGGKVKQHLAMVSRAVRERHSKVKNVAYLHNSEASGSCLQNKKGELLPTTLIAKKYSAKECGVLVPNPYFGDLDHWSNVAQLLEDASRKHPYWKRDPRAFWRGHIQDGETRTATTSPGTSLDFWVRY